MADESIVIEVKDGIDSAISAKIKGIGTEARSAQKDINSLQRSINGLNFNSIKALSTASTSASAAINKLNASQQGLAAAQTRAAIGAQQLATAQEKAARASVQAATAAQQLVSETNKAAKSQIDAQNAALRLAAAQDRAKKSAEAAAAKAAGLNEGLDKNAKSFNAAGISVKQYNAAMRGVPAQITDIVVSLQGGQRPLTVLLQQGGQLKDMFGGIGPAAKALTAGFLAMINPVTVLAAAFGAFLFVAYKVETELRTLNGLSAQFAATGRGDIDNSFIVSLRKELMLLPGISKSVAGEVIKEFANVRDIGGGILKTAAGTVADLATALGIEAPEAAKKLAESLYDPIKGAQDLDKALGFLTVADFKAIDSLSKLGKNAQAQQYVLDKLKLSIDGLANDSLTPLQRATNDLGNSWNAFTANLSNSGPIKAATELFANLLVSLTGILNKLAEYKPPAWLEEMTRGGLNGAVANMFKSGNTGGATGSWGASTTRTAEQMLPTRTKTDAAGITGNKSASKEAENRAKALMKVNAELDNQFKLMNMIGPEREKEEMLDRIKESFLGRFKALSSAESAALREKINLIVENNAVASEYNRIYQDSIQPLQNYNASLAASDKLLSEGLISEKESNKQKLIAFNTYEKINAPLNLYLENLENQSKLLKYVGDELEIETQLQNIQNDALQRGTAYTRTELAAIESKIQLNQVAARTQAAYNDIYQSTVGVLRENTAAQEALTLAEQNGILTMDQASIRRNQLMVEAANARLQMGGENPFDLWLVSLGKLTEGYKGLTVGMTESFGTLFTSLEDGFANSIGKAVVYSDDLSTALKDVARSALSELIGSLVKLGVQYAANALLGESISATAMATQTGLSVAAAATTAAAWAAPAALVSLASFGANSVPAIAGITATTALTQGLALASVAGFESGGYTGNMASDKVAGVVHGNEFVMDSAATNRIGVGNLEALRTGAASLNTNSNSATSGTVSSGNVSITVENTGTPQTYEQVPGLSANEVRLIARDVVSKESPGIVAATIQNPNSQMRKSLNAFTNTTRR